MKATLTALTVAATMFASSASAFDPDDRQKLKDTGSCKGCNLYSANLRGANLRNANLSNANLFEADLSYPTMKGAILCNTTMPDGSVIYSGC
jgi:uncharacterized protein YjbI with pentapeptide repeats